jgi:hypothetical protein
MPEPSLDTPTLELTSLPYHRALPDFLKRHDARLWEWFRDTARDTRAAEDAKFELLKSTYRLDRAAHPELYELAGVVASELGVDVPLTLYQAQCPQSLNASLAFVPGEVHLIFHGPVTSQLTPGEVRGLLGHELCHYVLLHQGEGELLTARELLRALVNDRHAQPAYYASWRLLHLYGEIFCDRGAYLATRDLLAVVSMLVKVHTGTPDVSPESYLRQAEEIFEQAGAATAEHTHPEAFIRARALKLWVEGRADATDAIERMIEGEPGLDELDLLAQERVAATTRALLDRLLWRPWFQTDAILAHARLFFEGYVPPAGPLPAHAAPSLTQGEDARPAPASFCDYACYVLLDFATADRDLEEAPLAAALEAAEELGIKLRFVELAQQELRLRKGQIEKLDARRERVLADALREPTARR